VHVGDHAFRDPMVLDVLTTPAPQAMYVELAARCPVQKNADGSVTLLRMADIKSVNKNPATRGNGHSGGGIGAYTRPLIPLDLDGAEHRRWRSILNPLFSPARMAPLKTQIRDVANGLLDAFVDEGHAEVVQAWCVPLPSAIFLSIMGLPQEDLPEFHDFVRNQLRPDRSLPREVILERMSAAAERLYAYFNKIYDIRCGQASFGDDLIGWILGAGEDQILAREDYLDLMYMLMLAGLDTVTASLSSILSYLARHPDHRRQLVADPQLWGSAVDELMRFETPVQYAQRKADVDLELPSGETIPANTLMYVSWSAANLDHDTFPNPLEVNLRRSPNPHIAYASGMHRCLGSHLARLELRVALEEFHRRIPEYELAPGTKLTYSGVARMPQELPLCWN
jgi:cytochrome P450